MRKLIIMLVVVTLTASACSKEDPASAGTPAVTTTVDPTTTAPTTSTTTSPTTTTVAETTTTSSTTLPPPPLGCGAEFESRYERRYSFYGERNSDGERPAPLNVLWEENINFSDEVGDRSIVLSGILLGVTTEERPVTSTRSEPAVIADFCFQLLDGSWEAQRFMVTFTEYLTVTGFQWKAINIADLYQIGDILPFGHSNKVDGVVSTIACETCWLTPQDILDVLVVGRQYVFEIIVHSEPLVVTGYEEEEERYQTSLSNNRAIVAWLKGTGPAPAEGTIGTIENAVWFAPWGEI